MRRGNFSAKQKYPISFDQDWKQYQGGFGDVEEGEFWIGLETIHQMTKNNDSELQVDLEGFDGDVISIVYDSFKLGSEAEKYKLHVS
jgi:hypothetical protein